MNEPSFRHSPVMLDEVVEVMAAVPPGVVIDATVGGGGHAAALLDRRPDIQLLGLDRDDEALEAAHAALARFGNRVTLRKARFDALVETAEEVGMAQTTGALFDLGVSSPQFDRAERGFSYRREGPLDMRMDQTQPRTAADVVNGTDEATLARILRQYGDERYARRIAKAIVAARPLHTTTELATVVAAAIPAPARRQPGHPARRSFQALRIEVNGELDVLSAALDQALSILRPGGRCAVISYHSGEDRIVKARFADAVKGGCTCPPGLPCTCGATPSVRIVRPVKRRPTSAEVERNPRAASAVLRVVEKIEAA